MLRPTDCAATGKHLELMVPGRTATGVGRVLLVAVSVVAGTSPSAAKGLRTTTVTYYTARRNCHSIFVARFVFGRDPRFGVRSPWHLQLSRVRVSVRVCHLPSNHLSASG